MAGRSDAVTQMSTEIVRVTVRVTWQAPQSETARQIAQLTWVTAGRVRLTQTGKAQDALYAVALGLLLLALLALRL